MNLKKATRKNDLITFIAVFLFTMVVIFEIALVILLPTKLRSENLWKRDVAYEEMIELEDSLRGQYRDLVKQIKQRNKSEAQLAELVLSNMDDLANYLRLHGEQLNKEQIFELQEDLNSFNDIYWKLKRWKKRPPLIVEEKIDGVGYFLQKTRR